MPAAHVTRFGKVVLAGKPNAGKSTLLNALIGEKLAIVSPKPQSTRTTVMGLLTEGDCQLLFMDSPGLLEPSNLLQKCMLEQARQTLNEANAILFLHPADEHSPPALQALVPSYRTGVQPVATVLTKADLASEERRPASSPPFFVVSAKQGEGVTELIDWCRNQAVPGEFRYDPEDIGTQPVRFFVAELVRESAFEVLEQELPYATAAIVDEFREDREPVYIRIILYVERESQKGIVIGKGGGTIKAIGAAARSKIERLMGERVFLDLWVKVYAKWRKSPEMLRMLGLPVKRKKGLNA